MKTFGQGREKTASISISLYVLWIDTLVCIQRCWLKTCWKQHVKSDSLIRSFVSDWPRHSYRICGTHTNPLKRESQGHEKQLRQTKHS